MQKKERREMSTTAGAQWNEDWRGESYKCIFETYQACALCEGRGRGAVKKMSSSRVCNNVESVAGSKRNADGKRGAQLCSRSVSSKMMTFDGQ